MKKENIIQTVSLHNILSFFDPIAPHSFELDSNLVRRRCGTGAGLNIVYPIGFTMSILNPKALIILLNVDNVGSINPFSIREM